MIGPRLKFGFLGQTLRKSGFIYGLTVRGPDHDVLEFKQWLEHDLGAKFKEISRNSSDAFFFDGSLPRFSKYKELSVRFDLLEKDKYALIKLQYGGKCP